MHVNGRCLPLTVWVEIFSVEQNKTTSFAYMGDEGDVTFASIRLIGHYRLIALKFL